MKRFIALVLFALVCATNGSAQSITNNTQTTHDGYFISYWRDGGAVEMKLGRDGNYGMTWNASDANFVGGKGWRRGSSSRIIGYKANLWKPRGNAWLALYGWTRKPLVEYYVVETWGNWKPPGAKSMGVVKTDGGTYRIYRTQRVNKPSIEGTKTFYQYWSVRTFKQRTGRDQRITFANHVKAWASLGMKLGAHDYQVLATEAYHSTGKSNITVWEE